MNKDSKNKECLSGGGSPALGVGAVGSRFSLFCILGLNVIEFYCRWQKLSFEKQLIYATRWLKFIYYYSPFSKCRKDLIKSYLFLSWLRFLNSPFYLFVVVILGVGLSLVIVYLTINYKLK